MPQQRFIDEILLNNVWVEGVDVDDNTLDARAWTNFVLGYQGEARGSAV